MRLYHALRRTVAFAEPPKRTPYDLQLVSCASRESGRSSLMRPPSSAPAHFFRAARKKPAKNYFHSTGPSTIKRRILCVRHFILSGVRVSELWRNHSSRSGYRL